MTNVIMIKQIIRIGIDQIVEIGEFSLVVDIKDTILEDRIIEEDTEEIIRMRAMTEKEVGVGLEKEHI